MLSKQCPNICEKIILRADTFIHDNCVNILDKIIVTDQEMSFYQDVMQYNYTQIRKERQNAISHFHSQFGLDFSSTVPNKENVVTIEGAILKPFYISPEIKYTSNYGCVCQGGWIVLIVDQGVNLTGKYGGKQMSSRTLKPDFLQKDIGKQMSSRTLKPDFLQKDIGSEGKNVEAGTMLLFGYYNIMNLKIRWGRTPTTSVKVLHFKSSVPSKMIKSDFWSIKVDIWDPELDRKYKKITGWYKKHHHMSLMARENCKEHNIPDEGLWGNTSGCSSLAKKGDVWHIMIKTILQFPMSKSDSEKRVGGGEPPVASTSTSTERDRDFERILATPIPRALKAGVNIRYHDTVIDKPKMIEAIKNSNFSYIQYETPYETIFDAKYKDLLTKITLENIDIIKSLILFARERRSHYSSGSREHWDLSQISQHLYNGWISYLKTYINEIREVKFVVDGFNNADIILNKIFMDKYIDLLGLTPGAYLQAWKKIDGRFNQETLKNVQKFYFLVKKKYQNIMDERANLESHIDGYITISNINKIGINEALKIYQFIQNSRFTESGKIVFPDWLQWDEEKKQKLQNVYDASNKIIDDVSRIAAKNIVKFLGQFDTSLLNAPMEDLLDFYPKVLKLKASLPDLEIYRRAYKLLSESAEDRIEYILDFFNDYINNNALIFIAALKAKKDQIKLLPENSAEYKRLEKEIKNLRNVL